MEPVTHFLTGACISRTGLNRKSAYMTLAMTLAAEAPDIDIFWGRNPTASVEFHRGFTHTFLGAPVMTTAVCGAVWMVHRWRCSKGTPRMDVPLRWGWLWGGSLLATLSHIFLDYTNNYGVRPFAPFNPRWYAGSFVFIFEPVIFLALLVAFIAPWLFGLTDSEIGVREEPFRGQGWATAMLLFIALLWSYRAWEHHVAVTDVLAQDWHGEVLRVSANPYPITPWKWHAVVETPVAFIAATVNTRTGTVENDAVRDTFYKPPQTPAILAAKTSQFGRVYLDWSQWPLVDDLGRAPLPDGSGQSATLVRFRDLRFAWSMPGLSRLTSGGDSENNAPLSAAVYVDESNHPLMVQMGSKTQLIR